MTNVIELARKNATKETIRRNQADLDKWEQFKLKVCEEVRSKKHLY